MATSTEKHTPGPWTVEEYGDEDCPTLVIHKDSERRVCFMATPGSHGDPAVIEANARLIAAAPDLLAALIAALPRLAHTAACYSARPSEEWAEHGSASFENCDCEIKTVRAAIARATA